METPKTSNHTLMNSNDGIKIIFCFYLSIMFFLLYLSIDLMIANSKLRDLDKKIIELQTLMFEKEIKLADPEIKNIEKLEFEYTK